MKKKSNVHHSLRVLVLLIAAVVMLSAMQLNLLAVGVDVEELQNDNTETTQTEEINTIPLEAEDTEFYEVTEYREEYAKHFHLSDGTYRAITYASPIHRKDANGNWQDIDNRLLPNTTAKGTATYASSDGRISFARSSSDFATSGIYTLSENGYTVSLSALEQSQNDNMSMSATASAELSLGVVGAVENHSLRETFSDSDSDEVKFAKASKVDNRSTLTYENVFSNTDLEYVLSANSVKENIIVKSPRASYAYTFMFSTDGLVATLEENGQILLTDSESEEVVYYIPAPYMYDASGKISYAVAYELIEVRAGQYLLTVSADSTWINAADRAFPVVIDPTIETARNIVYDMYVSASASDSVYGDSSELWVSNDKTTFIQIGRPTLPANRIIVNAELWVSYYYYVDSGYVTVGAYECLYGWSTMYSTWNVLNQRENMGLSTTMSASAVMDAAYGSEDNPEYAYFDLTELVRKWYNGTSTNNGVALKRIASQSTNQSVILVSSEANNADDHAAHYVIDYQLLEEGVYGLRNVGNDGLWMDIQYNSTSPGARVQQSVFSSGNPVNSFSRSGLFKVNFHNGKATLRTMLNNELVVMVTDSNDEIIRTANVSSSGVGSAPGAQFEIIPADETGVYYIRYGESEVVCANNTTASGMAGAPLSYLTLKTPEQAGDQGKWEFVKYTGAERQEIKWTQLDNEIMSGQTVDYHAIMYSTNIDYNGPITYSVAGDINGTPIGGATINSFGELKATSPGTVWLSATYSGAPAASSQLITIKPAGCKEYYEIVAKSSESYDINCQGYAFWTHDRPGFFEESDWYTLALNSENSNQAMYGVTTATGNTITGVKELLEDNYLDVYFADRWEEVTSSNGALDIEVNPDNQWVVAFRMGRDPGML